MGLAQSNSFRFAKMLAASDRIAAGRLARTSLGEVSSSGSDTLALNLDESAALASVKELIDAEEYALDELLTMIADVARQLTAAPGAALAMWKDRAMVCRARSGNLAPALGALLGASSGISGACLRSGKVHHCADAESDPLVDREVCRALGLRSMVAMPIHSWRGVGGVLEIFSDRPAAFTEKHIRLLQELAALAERARRAHPEDSRPPGRTPIG